MAEDLEKEQRPDEVSVEYKTFLTVAGWVIKLTTAYCIAATIGGLLIAIIGELNCAQQAAEGVSNNRIIPILALTYLIITSFMRKLGDGSDERLRMSFDLYSIPIFGGASWKITFSFLFFMAMMMGCVAIIVIVSGATWPFLTKITLGCLASANLI